MKEGIMENMGMTNKQFQAIIRLVDLVRKIIKLVPQEHVLSVEKELDATLQLLKEDD